MSGQKIAVEIYTESTPNPSSLKFVTNINLLAKKFVEFKKAEDAMAYSMLAAELFTFEFVKSVFISNNFITVTKKIDSADWYELTDELRQFIRSHIQDGKEVISQKFWDEDAQKKEQFEQQGPEGKIIDLLDKYVKPAVEMDGGQISFSSFENGTVHLIMQGSCAGCPSASVTLKSGIENMLKRMVPEVVAVEEA